MRMNPRLLSTITTVYPSIYLILANLDVNLIVDHRKDS